MNVLKTGGSAVDAVEIAIKCLEDREITNAGYGSNLAMDGVVECDALIVDHNGRSGGAGAVARRFIKRAHRSFTTDIFQKSRTPSLSPDFCWTVLPHNCLYAACLQTYSWAKVQRTLPTSMECLSRDSSPWYRLPLRSVGDVGVRISLLQNAKSERRKRHAMEYHPCRPRQDMTLYI
jgi:hypothetical protein